MNPSAFVRQLRWHFLLLILLVPLLFINRHDWHNWGDDFAQYIAQARNIVQKVPQQQTGYIYASYSAELPPAYPVGFPLILAPVYSIYELEMKAMTLFMSFIAVAAGLSVFIFLNNTFPPLWSVLATLIMMYSPWTVDFKEQVLSDFPFLIFFLAGFLLVNRKPFNLWTMLITGFVLGIMLSIRIPGVAFIAAITIKSISDLWLKQTTVKEFARQIASVTIATGVYLLLNKVFFPVTVAGTYTSPLNGLFFHLHRNLQFNFKYLKDFLAGQENASLWSAWFGYLVISVAAAGILFKLRKKGWGLMEWSILFYAAILSVLPWYAGFRYLLPVFPFFLFYLLSGTEGIAKLVGLRAEYFIVPLVLTLLALFSPGIYKLHNQRNRPQWSPYEAGSMEAMHFIKDSLPPGSLVMFEKPRALALFTGCRSIVFPSNPNDATTLLQQYRVDYFAQHADLNHDDYSNFINQYAEKKRVWANEKCVIYKNLAAGKALH